MTAATASLPADARAPRDARRLVTGVAGEAGVTGDVVDVAALLVTELVTNAVVHGGSAVEVSVEVGPGGELSVRVSDADSGPLLATARPVDELAEGGRGLQLVDALASAWGTEHVGGRKTLWFRVGSSQTSRSDQERQPVPAPVPGPPRPEPASPALVALLLDPGMEAVSAPDEQLRELMARGADALGADLLELRLDDQDSPPVRHGERSERAVEELCVDVSVLGARAGELRAVVARSCGPDEKALLQLLSSRLALLIAETRLSGAERRRRDRFEFLAEASELLAGMLDVDLALALVAQLVVPRMADWCAVHKVDERERLRLVTAHHHDEAAVDALHHALTADARLRELTRSGAAAMTTVAAGVTVTVAGEAAAVVTVPLRARGRTVGVLLLGRQEPLDAADLGALQDLARQAALVVDSGRLYAEQVEAAEALQGSLLPAALPSLPGLDVAARYHAAAAGLTVGGDFYDAVEPEEGRLVLVIGDVCGKGAEAAAVTGVAREVLRLLLHEGYAVPTALRRLNRVLREREHARFCTLAVADVRLEQEQVQVQLWIAGHPLPVLVRRDGSSALIGEAGDLLGVLADDDLDLPVTDLTLAPGETVVLYTDGVTERRDSERMFGEAHLRRTLEAVAGQSASAVVSRVQRAARDFVDAPLRDDLAVLALRHEP